MTKIESWMPDIYFKTIFNWQQARIYTASRGPFVTCEKKSYRFQHFGNILTDSSSPGSKCFRTDLIFAYIFP